MRLKTLTYTSLAKLDLTDNDLHDILRSARRFNALEGITGLLVFDGRRFLQIVEGAEEAIDGLVLRLRSDTRHSAFEVRDERILEQRSFPDWSMELVRVRAGYLDARQEIGSKLPPSVSPIVRDIALRMSEELVNCS